jgi:hypothetical protein
MAATIHDEQHRATFVDRDFVRDQTMEQRRTGLGVFRAELHDRVIDCLRGGRTGEGANTQSKGSEQRAQ